MTEPHEAPSGASWRVPGGSDDVSVLPVGAPVDWASTPADRIRPPEPGRVRLRLVVAYRGTRFNGLAPQPGLPTVGGEIISALTKILRQPPGTLSLVMSGRTDAGVHAWGQVLHVDVQTPTSSASREPVGAVVAGIDLGRVLRSLNSMLGPDISVRSVDVAPPTFDARFSALWRRYRYTLIAGGAGDPFLDGLVWTVHDTVDLSVMRLASFAFVGDHDFASFCRAPEVVGGTTQRQVLAFDWTDLGGGVLQAEITALAFCQQMVRSMVGFVVDVGRGKRSAGEVLAVLEARSRDFASPLAPADGLCLWEVAYPDEVAPPVSGGGWRPRP
jgi:tRNA pseudouridine38-40 synthase